MQEITTIGLDLAKSVFQGSSVAQNAVDRDGKVLVRRQIRRNQMLEFFAKLTPCLVGMEACAFVGETIPRGLLKKSKNRRIMYEATQDVDLPTR